MTPGRAAGRDLVVWYDDDERHIFDAYCPHLGAHFGYGGRVVDGCLVCPFHEWSFAADGSNVDIPYATKPNRKARVRSYPTMVRNRQVLFWYHPDPAVAPAWDMPEAVEGTAVECMRFSKRVRSVWQESRRTRSTWPTSPRCTACRRWGGGRDGSSTVRCGRVQSAPSFNTARGDFEGASSRRATARASAS